MYVYAYYDKKNIPIYIGQAEDVVKRYGEHQQSDDWIGEVEKIIIHGPYPSTDDLNYFEKYYVRKEQPKYNKNLLKSCNYKEIADPYGSIVFDNATAMKDNYYQAAETLKRGTYYLRMDQLEMLDIVCFVENEDKSKFVRDMFDMYFQLKSKEHGRNFQLEAEQRLKRKM